jgi:hypothetical protein
MRKVLWCTAVAEVIVSEHLHRKHGSVFHLRYPSPGDITEERQDAISRYQ